MSIVMVSFSIYWLSANHLPSFVLRSLIPSKALSVVKELTVLGAGTGMGREENIKRQL